METKQVVVRVPVDLMTAARQALDRESDPTSDVIRAALAQVAGLDPRDWKPLTGRPGHRPKVA